MLRADVRLVKHTTKIKTIDCLNCSSDCNDDVKRSNLVFRAERMRGWPPVLCHAVLTSDEHYNTNICMISGTKNRILHTAAALFAEHGYRGASVRRICDLARANPGAVSYHFGGKKQLYRTVLRRAAAALAELRIDDRTRDESSPAPELSELLDRLIERLPERRPEIRLLLRDLADGGGVAVEALEPRWCRVTGTFASRGGVGISVEAEYGAFPEEDDAAEPEGDGS